MKQVFGERFHSCIMCSASEMQCPQMAASAGSKVVASTATYPHEVVRSHMHISGIASVAGLVNICKDVSVQPVS